MQMLRLVEPHRKAQLLPKDMTVESRSAAPDNKSSSSVFGATSSSLTSSSTSISIPFSSSASSSMPPSCGVSSYNELTNKNHDNALTPANG